LGPSKTCYQEWNYLGVTVMVAEYRPRSATNIIFMTVLVSLLTIN